jgi:UDP-N-acetylglucosamine 2-epimerase
MNTKRIVTVLGTRPQIIKSSVVSRALAMAKIEETIIHTGQHYTETLSEIFLREFDILPNYSLGISPDSPNNQTAEILWKLEPLLIKEKPDLLLVYGDCTTTAAAAICASRLDIPVAHIESGPRQYSLSIPEEINRVMVDHLSSYLFAPTSLSVANLHNEHISPLRVWNTGDVMLDLFDLYYPKAKTVDNGHILFTAHRPVNTDNHMRLKAIINAVNEISKSTEIIWPLHPRTKAAIKKSGNLVSSNVSLAPPLSYLETLQALRGASMVITDSGGLQKEAFFAHKPTLTIDSSSPWPETISSGWNRVVMPADLTTLATTPWTPLHYHGNGSNPFGDGHAATKIANILREAK